jgi:hypothetical protein
MLILNFTYPLRCLRVPLGVRVPPVEYHWARGSLIATTQFDLTTHLNKIESVDKLNLKLGVIPGLRECPEYKKEDFTRYEVIPTFKRMLLYLLNNF